MVAPQRDHPGQLWHRSQTACLGLGQDWGGAERRGCRGRTSWAAFHPWRPHCKDFWLLLEPNRCLGHLLSIWRQHHAGGLCEEKKPFSIMTFKLSSISKSALSAKLSVMPLLQNLLVKKPPRFGRWQRTSTTTRTRTPQLRTSTTNLKQNKVTLYDQPWAWPTWWPLIRNLNCRTWDDFQDISPHFQPANDLSIEI